MDNNRQHRATWYDRTTIPEHRYATPTRNLKLHRSSDTRYPAGRTKCLTVCESWTPVRIRHRKLRASIVDYIEVALRFGLNIDNVRTAYNNRADNGYAYTHRHTVNIDTNATFRGGDH